MAPDSLALGLFDPRAFLLEETSGQLLVLLAMLGGILLRAVS